MAMEELSSFIPQDILSLYEVHNYRHAAQILTSACPDEFSELVEALRIFRIAKADIIKPGGNESDIPKRISTLLRPRGWYETKIKADLIITQEMYRHESYDEENKGKKQIKEERTIREGYLDGHKIDYVKNGVAFDLEWNSKDQTFDRDLYAFRTFYECSLINAGILLTRSSTLNPIFAALGVAAKYGASTTWMGKLLYRLHAGRAGGCPVLVLGITPKLIVD